MPKESRKVRLPGSCPVVRIGRSRYRPLSACALGAGMRVVPRSPVVEPASSQLGRSLYYCLKRCTDGRQDQRIAGTDGRSDEKHFFQGRAGRFLADLPWQERTGRGTDEESALCIQRRPPHYGKAGQPAQKGDRRALPESQRETGSPGACGP